MPLGNQTGLVTSIGKVVGHSHFIVMQITPPTTRAVCTGAGRIPPGHQSSPCGRAKRAHMIISQSDGLGMQLVQVWGLDDRITMTSLVPIALVISHDQDDIRLFAKRESRNIKRQMK